MKVPNLFHYATSELSQDAIICWLLAWAAPHCASLNPRLHECGNGLLMDFLARKQIVPDAITSVEVKKQTDNIDVQCIVNGTYAVIVEDKTGTSSHGNQLERYMATVKSKGYAVERIVPIYYKTYDQSNYVKEKEAGYSPYTRADILRQLAPFCPDSHLIHDYVEHLKSVESQINAFRTTPIDKWDSPCWVGFYSAVKNALGDGDWDYVANPSGGFMGFWCLWSGSFYVQLEQSKLCLKIETNNTKELLDSRWRFSDRATEVASDLGTQFSKPSRFGTGNYVTYSVYNGEYRKIGEDGFIDVAATVQTIQQAGDIAEQMNREHQDPLEA